MAEGVFCNRIANSMAWVHDRNSPAAEEYDNASWVSAMPCSMGASSSDGDAAILISNRTSRIWIGEFRYDMHGQ